MALAAALVAVLALLTVNRLNLWRDPLALYENDLQVEPDNPVLHTIAGMAARERGLAETAHRHFRRAHELYPRDFFAPAEPPK
jgi:hypothetical protein